MLLTTPVLRQRDLARRRRPGPRTTPARVTLDNATMREVASSTPSGSDGSRVYVFDLNAAGLARQQVLADRRPDQRALHRRRALHALGRDLRRAATGAGAGGAGSGPCHGVAGWRLAGASATIDSVMVLEPALPVVRRATKDDVTPWRPNWRGPSSTTPSPPTSSATRRAARPGCAPSSAPRCGPTTSPSAAATRPRATAARPSGPRPASRCRRGCAGSSPCCPCCPTWRPTCARRCAC